MIFKNTNMKRKFTINNIPTYSKLGLRVIKVLTKIKIKRP